MAYSLELAANIKFMKYSVQNGNVLDSIRRDEKMSEPLKK